jgi:peptidoglycan/LPS O-acetylase OafA/YrhL
MLVKLKPFPYRVGEMRGNLPALTSLRFFAAAAIFALHAEQFAGFPKGAFAGFTLNHGVSFFYVLSGFILHYNYRDRATKIGWLKFTALRFARVWPLHIMALIFASALAWSDICSWYHAYLSPWSLASIILMLHAWATKNTVFFAINGVSWSISVEMFFYACFLPLSVLLRTRASLTVAIYGGALLLYMVVTWEVGSLRLLKEAFYSINPFFRLTDFIIGILAAEYWMRTSWKQSGTAKWTMIEAGSIGCMLLVDLLTQPVVSGILKNAFYPARALLYVSMVDPFFAILICVFAHGRGLISRALHVRPLILLGEWSFALYLVHQPIQRFMSMHPIGLSPIPLTIACFGIALCISAAGYYSIELPLYGRARRAISLRKQKRSLMACAPGS